MVNSGNLIPLVERLIQQLRTVPTLDGNSNDCRDAGCGVEPAADSEGEDPEEILRPSHELRDEQQALPVDYRITVIRHIIDMCSRDTYANIIDFEWYIRALLQLIKLVPSGTIVNVRVTYDGDDVFRAPPNQDISGDLGRELRNAAVRVHAVRVDAVKAADLLLARSRGGSPSGPYSTNNGSVLGSAAWVVGEYASDCTDANGTLNSLLDPLISSLSTDVICAYLQAIPKVFAQIVSEPSIAWNAERRTMTSLLAARILCFLEPLANHPDLDVQERAIQFLELIRIGSQAVNSQGPEIDYGPNLLTTALPHLFLDGELKPVAPSAQRRVPPPAGLDLTIRINPKLPDILQDASGTYSTSSEIADFEQFYNQRPPQKALAVATSDMLPSFEMNVLTYQQDEENATDTGSVLRKRQEKFQRHRDDPFYIGGAEASSGSSTPFHDILRDSNGEGFDVDSIPIMDLNVGLQQSIADQSDHARHKRRRPKKASVVQDITIEDWDSAAKPHLAIQTPDFTYDSDTNGDRKKKSFLEVDSSSLGGLSLDEIKIPIDPTHSVKQETEDLEMAKALAEVERLRLEMQRASERVQAADGAPAEGTLVKLKKRKHPRRSVNLEDGTEALQTPLAGKEVIVEKKRKKKKKKKRMSAVLAIARENI